MPSTIYQVFTFHQLPIVNTDNFRGQYHVVVRVAINEDGTVRWSSAATFLISLQPHDRSAFNDDIDHAFGDQESWAQHDTDPDGSGVGR